MARKIPFARDTGLHLSSTGGFSETKLGLVERRASLRQRSDLMRSSFKEENVRRMIRRAGIEMHAHGKADLISAVRSLLDHLSFELLKESVIPAEGAIRQTLNEQDLTQALASVRGGPYACPGDAPLRPCRTFRDVVERRRGKRSATQEVEHEANVGFDCFYLPVSSLKRYFQHVLQEVSKDERGIVPERVPSRMTPSFRHCLQLALETMVLEMLGKARLAGARIDPKRKTVKSADLLAVADMLAGIGHFKLIEGRSRGYSPSHKRRGAWTDHEEDEEDDDEDEDAGTEDEGDDDKDDDEEDEEEDDDEAFSPEDEDSASEEEGAPAKAKAKAKATAKATAKAKANTKAKAKAKATAKASVKRRPARSR